MLKIPSWSLFAPGLDTLRYDFVHEVEMAAQELLLDQSFGSGLKVILIPEPASR
jgi:hypothetical protein